ncbi:MAG: cyclic nucleotide-binding domain-containing protein, partial [Myxococcota bacterium]
MADVAEIMQPEYSSNPELDHVASSHPLLAALDSKSLETVMGLSKLTVYRPKRTVVRAGEEPRYAHLLLDGTVRVFHRNDTGEELTTLLLTGPAVFNDNSALTDSAADESVVTLERSTVLSVP